jgi:hypothetical protein
VQSDEFGDFSSFHFEAKQLQNHPKLCLRNFRVFYVLVSHFDSSIYANIYYLFAS